MSDQAEISLPVDRHTLAQAQKWLEAAAARGRWPARTLFKIRLCLDETLTNIAMYGYPQERPAGGEPCVRLRLREEGRRLTLDVMDNGVAFDPTARTPRELDATLDEAEIGGHGLRLMLHYLEDIRHERREGWNHLQLVAAIDDAP
ncbi:ATP-binding protein [Alcaligenaceae bacterium]|nr:ATP-binding protein [Alcaligenaceae bacterium]